MVKGKQALPCPSCTLCAGVRPEVGAGCAPSFALPHLCACGWWAAPLVAPGMWKREALHGLQTQLRTVLPTSRQWRHPCCWRGRVCPRQQAQGTLDGSQASVTVPMHWDPNRDAGVERPEGVTPGLRALKG